MQLDQLQSNFTAALLDADSIAPQGIVSRTGAPASRRFAVYRNNVIASLVDALKTGFPVTVRIVGDEFFRAMASVFVRAYPPSSPIMMLYGEKFPEFLKTFQPVAHLCYLPDIARLEQLRREAYHAADAEPLPVNFLDKVAPADLPSLRFDINPATRLLASNYPVMSIWRWHDVTDAAKRPPLTDTGEDLLVTRHNGTVIMRRLTPGGVAFFSALQSGETLEAALELSNNHKGFDLADSISALIDSRVVTCIY